jgi:hypothetical protein
MIAEELQAVVRGWEAKVGVRETHPTPWLG